MTEIRTGIKLTGDASGLNAEFVKSEKNAGKLNDAVGKVRKGTQDLGDASDKTGQQLGSVSRGLRDVISVAAGWQLGRMAIAASDDMTILQSRLKLVTGSAIELSYVQQRLFGIAQQSRVSYTELGATYAQIARASAELGISQERILGVTQSIGQAMAISGGSAESMKAALIQLSQGLASGTLRGEELNSVMEQTPRLAQAIAQGMGVSLGQLRALGQDGKLTALGVIEALEMAAPALRREFEQVTPTIGQAFTTLKNSSGLFIDQLDKATGSSANLRGGVGALGSVVDGLTGSLRVFNSTGENSSETLDTFTAAGSALAEILKVIVVLGANVAYTIKGMVTEVAILAAQGKALLTGDFSGAAAIRAAALDESAKARERVDRFSAAVLGRSGTGARPTADAKGTFLAGERAAEQRSESAVPFPGAKPLEEVRKYAKLGIDIQREAAQQRLDVEKAYANRIALASDPKARLDLQRERDARLIQLSKDAGREMQGIAEQGASEAKALAEARFSRDKALGERAAAFERKDLDQRTRTNEQFYKLGLVSVDEYYARKSALEVESIEISERLTKAELEQAKAVEAKAKKEADAMQAKARVLGLERELVDLASKKAAAQAEPGDQRALRDQAERDQVRDGVRADRVRSRDFGYDMATEMEEEVRRMGLEAIQDPYQRARAQLTAELQRRKELIDEILDPDAREQATLRFNDFAVAKNEELVERLKPGYVKLLESWNDTTLLMRESYNGTIENMLLDGEDAFVRSGGNVVATAKSVAKQIEAELLRLAYRKYMAESISNIGGGIFDAVVGAIFGPGTDTTALPTGDFARMDRANFSANHGGGIAGREATFFRSVSPSVFARAERRHTGGLVSGEVPIIAKRGEGVFTEGQMRALAPVDSMRGGAQVYVTVNNQTGSNVQVRKQERQDGGIDVIIDMLAEKMGDDIANGTGPIAGAMESRYGLRTAVS